MKRDASGLQKEAPDPLEADDLAMARASRGDVGQLSLLFDRHHARLYGFFVRMTGNPAVSDDLVQEVFLRILKYRRTFRSGSHFAAWMYQIARNARIDHARKHPPGRALEAVTAEEAGLVDPGDAERRQEQLLVRRALEELPDDKRELVILARFQGLRHREIAEILGCDTSVVRVRLFRAIQELRRAYLKLTGERVLWNAGK